MSDQPSTNQSEKTPNQNILEQLKELSESMYTGDFPSVLKLLQDISSINFSNAGEDVQDAFTAVMFQFIPFFRNKLKDEQIVELAESEFGKQVIQTVINWTTDETGSSENFINRRINRAHASLEKDQSEQEQLVIYQVLLNHCQDLNAALTDIQRDWDAYNPQEVASWFVASFERLMSATDAEVVGILSGEYRKQYLDSFSNFLDILNEISPGARVAISTIAKNIIDKALVLFPDRTEDIEYAIRLAKQQVGE